MGYHLKKLLETLLYHKKLAENNFTRSSDGHSIPPVHDLDLAARADLFLISHHLIPYVPGWHPYDLYDIVGWICTA